MISARTKPGRTRPHRRVRCLLLTLLVGCVLACGCGGPGYEVAPVSGRVTLNEKPIANIHVSFQPMQEGNAEPGPGSFGKTDAEGRFTLKTIADPPADGAIVGPHSVTLRVDSPESLNTDEMVAPSVMLPVRAVDGSISLEVPAEGTDQANIDLTSR